ncbi:MAG: glycosyltransferase family 39 protein [Planctomycetota bacterium]
MDAAPRIARLIGALGVTACVLALAAAGSLLLPLLNRGNPVDPSVTRTLLGARIAVAVGGILLILARRPLAAVLADEVRTLRLVLLVGLGLRVLAYATLWPHNNDPHYQVVLFLAEHGRFPNASESFLSFQAPLYYLLTAPLAMLGSDKLAQGLSLVLSLANLWMLYRLITGAGLLQSYGGRLHALALAVLLPQFVIFGLFISNDALAYPLGTAIFLLGYRYLITPSTRGLVALAIATGLGMLTKGTFNAFLVSIPPLLLAAGAHRLDNGRRQLRNLVIWGVITVVIGGYKYFANLIEYGVPIADNSYLDLEYIERQGGTYQGISSLVDVNVAKLVRWPWVLPPEGMPASEHTQQSLPLLYYGTYWYSHISDESGFNATHSPRFSLLPRLIYAAAVVPTLLMLISCIAAFWRNRSLRALWRDDTAGSRRRLMTLWVIGVMLLHFAVVTTWGLNHDAWSFFQSRLTFPAFFANALLLGMGLELWRRGRMMRDVLHVALMINYALLGAYLGIEIAFQLVRSPPA